MRIFITGITGTLGRAVSQKLVDLGHQVVGFSRDEQKQANLFPRGTRRERGITMYLGCIRDEKRVVEATRGCDLIFHFAALKMVDTLEENPEEAVATNVVGTMNVLHAQRIHGIPRVLMASTDKAVYAVNAYGASKKLAEKLVLRNPENVVCRYGNVLGSRGSVLPMFVKTLRAREQTPYVEITDRSMTRFWITADQAARFVVQAGITGPGGLRVPNLLSASVLRVADAVAQTINVPEYRVVDVGIRPGEKLHECLMDFSEGEMQNSDYAEMPDTELLELVKEALNA